MVPRDMDINQIYWQASLKQVQDISQVKQTTYKALPSIAIMEKKGNKDRERESERNVCVCVCFE